MSQPPPGRPASALAYPVFQQGLPALDEVQGGYHLCFARTPGELHEVQRLRYEVFNVELNEGLDSSHATGRDEDAYDATCHHLIVREREQEQIVGTYRLQTAAMAAAHGGFYSAEEFDLSSIPQEFLDDAVELGRACVAAEHRHQRVLFLLWRGLAAYMSWNRKRHCFGCSSLTSQDPEEGRRVMSALQARGLMHPTLRVNPRSAYRCYVGDAPVVDDPELKLPKLFRIYLRYGAKICGPPAIDRQFKTIDYLVALDIGELDEDSYKTFFAS